LAVFYTLPVPVWLAAVLAAGVVALYFLASRERFRIWQWLRTPWKEKRRTALVLALTGGFMLYYFGFQHPDPDLEWAPEQARIPHVTIDGNKVHVSDARNFTWNSRTDFQPGFYDRTYDVEKLDSMYYVVATMHAFEPVAHVFLCFGFSDGQNVAISVEGRRRKGESFGLLPSLFRQYQLIYVVGDERDVVGLRGAVWKDPVFFYPARASLALKRGVFLDMMERAHSLEEHPEFYNLVTNNCMNNITWHLRRLGNRTLPNDLQLLLTGLSPKVAYRLGYIDTDLPFARAQQAFRLDGWMQTTELDESFSRRLREALRKQVAAAKESIPPLSP
jgi:hypothetical protein